MNNLKISIGIEIHIELLTKTKMFSSSPNSFAQKPNTMINEVDMGYPGSLPILNKQAVIYAIRLAKALNMEIDNIIIFDRKHYYYPDLPKGYQITQQNRPIGKEGYVLISNNKKIDIQRIHMEEDTAKQIRKDKYIYLDFNRAGIPLIEIVTHPTMHNSEDAIEYIKVIQLLTRDLGISDSKMQNGSLRADINISLSKTEKLGTKVEIKNMNSFSNIKKAIDNEIKEQTTFIELGKNIENTTKRFDEKTQSNIIMRSKTSIIDYKYFKEPNIIPIKISKEFIESIKLNKLPWDRLKEYQYQGLNPKMIEQLMSKKDLSIFYNKIDYANKLLFAKIMFSVILPFANKEKKKINDLNIPIYKLIKLLTLFEENKITNSHIKILIPLLSGDKSVDELIKINKLFIISSYEELNKILIRIIKEEGLKGLKEEKIKKMLLGKLMKKTSGQANINIAKILIDKLII